MERFDPARVARRARRAYELARLKHALRVALPFAAALALAAAYVGTSQAAALAVLATGALVAARARGGAIARGVHTGALAGLVAVFCPLITTAFAQHHCSGCGPTTPMPLCLAACAAGGALAASLGSRRVPALRSTEAAAALATTALVGAVGCTVAGGFGLLGLVVGMILGGIPAALVRALR